MAQDSLSGQRNQADQVTTNLNNLNAQSSQNSKNAHEDLSDKTMQNNQDNQSKVVLITGASSGIGFAAAQQLAQASYVVYGAARRVEKITELEKYGVHAIKLDVTDEQSCKQAVQTIIDEQGRIDVLINNAGYGSYGAIEDVLLDEARRQFDVNLFGVAALVKEAMPYMRQQQSGTIINISSVAGRMVTFMGGWYHATKYALEAFSDALRMEADAFGINIVIIEPGGIKTPWADIAADHLEESSQNGAYREAAQQTAQTIRNLYASNAVSSPGVVVNAIVKAVGSPHPKPRYLIGSGAKPLAFLHAVLPTRVFDRFIKRVM